MRRLAIAGLVAFLLFVVTAAAADTLDVHLVSQTNSTITLGWTPQPGYGYLFSADGQIVSRTNDPLRTTVKFSKQYSTYEVAVITKGAIGSYPPPAPPPPPPPAACANGTDDDGDGKIDYPADPGCSSATDTDETDPVSPPPTGYPDASNTGVPAGTVLTNYTGPADITANNTVIDSKLINTCLTIEASGVVIRNSKIICTAGYWAIRSDPGANSGTRTLIEDTEISCAGHDWDGIDFANLTIRRVNIHSCANGMSIAENVTLEDSYLHDWNCCTDNHPDGIQFDGDLWGINTNDVVIRHNTISGQNADGSPGNASIISDSSQQQNILVENNLFYGGGFTLYCSNSNPQNYVVRNNKFSTRFYAKVGTFGPVIGCSGENGGGNVFYETGLPVDMSPE